MKHQIKLFDYEDKSIRVLKDENTGEPLWVAKDVCGVLGIKNSRDAIIKLDDDDKGVIKIDTLGGSQELSIINESGLYTLILRSNKPQAKKFKKWVTSEVLPSIRKTGRYDVLNEDKTLDDQELLLTQRELEETKDKYISLLEQQNGTLLKTHNHQSNQNDIFEDDFNSISPEDNITGIEVINEQKRDTEMAFINKAISVLRDAKKLNQGEFLAKLGKKDNDKTSTAILKENIGIYWEILVISNTYYYSLLKEKTILQHKRRFFTQEEDKYVLKNKSTSTTEQMAKILNRSHSSVTSRLAKLKQRNKYKDEYK